MGKDYPSDWNSRRKKVYKRDNYRCQKCGSRGVHEETPNSTLIIKAKIEGDHIDSVILPPFVNPVMKIYMVMGLVDALIPLLPTKLLRNLVLKN